MFYISNQHGFLAKETSPNCFKDHPYPLWTRDKGKRRQFKTTAGAKRAAVYFELRNYQIKPVVLRVSLWRSPSTIIPKA